MVVEQTGRGERSYDRRDHVLDDIVRESIAVITPLARADGKAAVDSL